VFFGSTTILAFNKSITDLAEVYWWDNI